MTTICCLCQKTKSKKGWSKKMVSSEQPLSHGYCPECYRKTIKQLEIRTHLMQMPAA